MKKPKTKKNVKDIKLCDLKPTKNAKGGREQSRLGAKYGPTDPSVKYP